MLSRRQLAVRIGNIGEKFAMSILSGNPKLVKQKCDIEQGSAKIEVKTSSLRRRSIPCLRGKQFYSWYGYRFNVGRQIKHADFFMLVCLDVADLPEKAFLIPAFILPNCGSLDLNENSKKFNEFLVYPQPKETPC